MMAIALDEPDADACMAALEAEDEVLISAGTLSEAFVVAARQNRVAEIAGLVARLEITVVSVTETMARQVGQAYARWGKGIHPARLNFGDCFAYALTKQYGCRLLYIGDDFAKTDIESAL
jgi:ribonuclease VapC